MMEQDQPDREKRKYPLIGFGGTRIPPAFDVALRWGITLAVAVLLGFFIGRWVDSKVGTTPLFLIIGVLWGVGGSFYSLFLQLKKLQQDEEKAEQNKS